MARVEAALRADPTLTARLGRDDLADVVTRSLRIADGPTDALLTTLSWGGPTGGAYVLTRCNTDVLAAARIGHVRHAEVVEASGRGRPEVLLRRITGVGTGWSLEETSIYEIREDGLAELWTGRVSETSYQAAGVGAYELNGSVELREPGTLTYRWTRVSLRPDGDTWVPVTSSLEQHRETWGWDESAGRFVRR